MHCARLRTRTTAVGEHCSKVSSDESGLPMEPTSPSAVSLEGCALGAAHAWSIITARGRPVRLDEDEGEGIIGHGRSQSEVMHYGDVWDDSSRAEGYRALDGCNSMESVLEVALSPSKQRFIDAVDYGMLLSSSELTPKPDSGPPSASDPCLVPISKAAFYHAPSSASESFSIRMFGCDDDYCAVDEATTAVPGLLTPSAVSCYEEYDTEAAPPGDVEAGCVFSEKEISLLVSLEESPTAMCGQAGPPTPPALGACVFGGDFGNTETTRPISRGDAGPCALFLEEVAGTVDSTRHPTLAACCLFGS